MRSFFVIASLFVTLISGQFLNQKQLPKAEYLHLILLSCAGFMLLVQCSHFISLFVCLELVTVAFYVLVAFQRTKVLSLEAGLKYTHIRWFEFCNFVVWYCSSVRYRR